MGVDVKLTKGTVEFLVVDVTDELANINTLVGTNAQYDYRPEGEANWTLQNQAPVIDGMQAKCLIDTTALAQDDYELYLHFDALPEHPRLGPFKFRVDR